MEWEFEKIVGWFERVYERTWQVAQAVPPDQLDWRPASSEFSCAELIRHIGSTEVMNVQRLETGKLVYPGHRENSGYRQSEVLAYLSNCHAQAINGLNRYGEAGLTRLIPTNHGQIEGWRVLVGLIEHEIHHRSQLCSYLSQLGTPPPPLYGLYVEELPTE